MRKTSLPILLAIGLAVAAPVRAETDFGQIVSGIAQSLVNQELDRNAYVEAQRLNTVPAYRAYLTKYPNGAFRTNAEQALARLGASVTPGTDPVTPLPGTGAGSLSAASVEAAIGLSRSQRIVIQKQLTALGYATGVADGLWGANTRRAIARWQTAQKLPASGYVTTAQVRLINQLAGPGVGDPPGGTITGDDPVEERLLGLTYDERREVQRRLTLLGYSTRGVDGSFGANTRRALATWQADNGLRASGYLTADQLRTLRRQSGG